MDFEQRYRLVTRNVEEVVVEEELRDLLRSSEKPRAYVGYEPSGEIHLGHMLTVQKLMDLQHAGFEITILLADIHAYLNEKGTFEKIAEIAEYNKRVFIALGLDEDKVKFVLGSEYQLEKDYVLDVLKMARMTTLNRARRSMDEVSRSKEDPMVSQMIYPLMQALDIAHLNIDVAVGGMDQRKIHMLARENLPKLGYKAPICLHTPILAGLDGQKMSSSKGNFISVADPPEVVVKKLEKAYCPQKVVEGNPVLEIARYHIFPRFGKLSIERDIKYGGDVVYENFDQLKKDYLDGKIHPLDLKMAVASYLNNILDSARKRLGGLSER
ncbi:MAG: tyrosine--tRNA ligase [Archaeoglobaceae archaeon]